MKIENSRMAIVGVTNTATMTISKIVTFAGSIITIAGVGGMIFSRKSFTEAEMNYLVEHLKKK